MSKEKFMNMEHDCTISCKYIKHGNKITNALTKRAVTDDQLAAYLNWLCANCGEVTDEEGRTALHLAASCGRLKLAQYLIHVHGAAINATDTESGCTALHRAVFYGQIHVAVQLIKLGAEIGFQDNGGLTAIDYAMRDRYPPYNLKDANSGEVYVWGCNDNYTLGIGNQQSRGYPDLLEVFRKDNISVKQVSLSKFHTLFLTTTGLVYSCGHGQGGRLGNGAENTVLSPGPVRFVSSGLTQEPCVHVSAGRDHSLFVMESGIVWACGLNSYSQLGLTDSPKSVTTPRPLKSKLSSVRYVSASRFHSVAWGPKGVFTWGLNSGQLGHDKAAGQFINAPKKVPGLGNSEITSVASSDGATVVTTSSGHIYVLHEFQCRKIGSKRHNITSVSVIGGHLSPSNALSHVLKEKGGDHLRILVLTTDGLLYIWTESSLQLIRCIYSLKRPLSIRFVALNLQNIYLVTDQGETFKGEFKTTKSKKDSSSGGQLNSQPSPFTNFLNRHECSLIKVMRVPNVYRAVSVATDGKGRNCAVIQANPSLDMSDLSCVSASLLQDQMLELYENMSLDDSLHDIQFKVGSDKIPAHKYIVFKSELIRELCSGSKDNLLVIDNVNTDIFKQMLKYMYVGTCDLLQVGVCAVPYISDNEKPSPDISWKTSAEFQYENNTVISAYEAYSKPKNKYYMDKVENSTDIMKKDPIRQLQYCAKRFGLSNLYSELDKFRYENGSIKMIANNKTKIISRESLSRFSNPELYDVSIKTVSGTSTSIIKAHRCVLASRLEYFSGMFMNNWRENKSDAMITLPYPQRVFQVVIDYIYTDDWPEMSSCEDIDFICQVMIVADQLFIVRLRELCELTLAQHITLKNVATFLQFSSVYNAVHLQESCLRYIFLNLAALLENHYLNILPDETLLILTEKYLEHNEHMSRRVITPYSTAPCDEEILEIYNKFSVDVKELSDANKRKLTPKKKNLPRRISESDKVRSRNESISESLQIECPSTDVNITSNASYLQEMPTNGESKQICCESQKQLNTVQTRLKAVFLGCNQEVKENFQTLPLRLMIENGTVLDFPELGKKTVENRNEHINSNKNSNEKLEVSKKSPHARMSQKQRKKLSKYVTDELDMVNVKHETQTTVSPWHIKNTGNDSFADILKNDQKSPDCVSYNIQYAGYKINSASQNQHVSPSTSPNNSSRKNEEHVFSDIIADQKQQRDNYSKMRSKPLTLTQIEDQAIEELERFYNIDGTEDEMISVSRVCSTKYASPLWIQKPS